MLKLVSMYDVDKSGRLEASELSKLLRDYSEAQRGVLHPHSGLGPFPFTIASWLYMCFLFYY
jgi:hypothetical protein